MRWTLLEHMLRQGSDTPQFRAMRLYFKKSFNGVKRKKYTGAPTTSTMTMRNNEFKMALATMKDEVNIRKIKSGTDLDRLKQFASDRRMWGKLVKHIRLRALIRWNKKECTRKNEPLPWIDTAAVGSSSGLTAEQRAITPRILRF